MVRSYAKRVTSSEQRLKNLIARIHAEGQEEFDVHDVYNEQEPLMAESAARIKRSYTGRYHFTHRQISALLHTRQKELGIEPAGYHIVSYSAYHPREEVKVWRFKH